MRDTFKQFLINEGYKEYTPSGNLSTVYDYIKRIDNVCKWEGTDWNSLAKRINNLLPEYEEGGRKSDLGAKSHNAVRCALRCFKRFIGGYRP